MGNPNSKQGRPESTRGTAKSSATNQTTNTNKQPETRPRKQSDVSERPKDPVDTRPKSNSHPNQSSIPLDDSFTEIPPEIQKKAAPPPTNNNIAAPKQIKTNDAPAEAITDSIPLEISPEDIEFGEFLGEGVYSEVYKGYCYGTQVAIKKFKNQSFDPEVLKGVRQEIKIMKSIRHPNLLLFLGASTKPGQLMIVTEIMETSFHDLDTFYHGTIDLLRKLKMSKEAARGVSWLHSLNPTIIHRDLKPENILVNRTSVKVADFGLSLVRDHSKQEAEEMKKIRGSPAFMSPEALLGAELTPKTDVYSFGMILWELYTGRSPYEDLELESLEELIEEICYKHTREKIPANCPPTLRQLIESCWQPSPSNRPTFLQIIAQLDLCILEIGIPDKDARRWWQKSFTQNGGLMFEVPWEQFLLHLAAHLQVSSSMKIFQCLKSIMIHNDQESVLMEDFGNILKWFGPIQSDKGSFLDLMEQLFQSKWFYGDISQEQAEETLLGAKPGTYLIRFSSSAGNYALSKMIENQEGERMILHVRIAHFPHSKYSFTLDDKVYEFASLHDLVKTSLLHLGNPPSGGSKYYNQLAVKQVTSGYVQSVN